MKALVLIPILAWSSSDVIPPAATAFPPLMTTLSPPLQREGKKRECATTVRWARHYILGGRSFYTLHFFYTLHQNQTHVKRDQIKEIKYKKY